MSHSSTNVSEDLAASIIRAMSDFYQTPRRYNPEDSHLPLKTWLDDYNLELTDH
jgi:hypothetical protein